MEFQNWSRLFFPKNSIWITDVVLFILSQKQRISETNKCASKFNGLFYCFAYNMKSVPTAKLSTRSDSFECRMHTCTIPTWPLIKSFGTVALVEKCKQNQHVCVMRAWLKDHFDYDKKKEFCSFNRRFSICKWCKWTSSFSLFLTIPSLSSSRFLFFLPHFRSYSSSKLPYDVSFSVYT